MSLVTTTQAVKQIHADSFVIEVADIKGEVSFFFYRMRLDATAGVCLAFLCAFRTLIALLSLQYSLNHLKIHIIDFTIHDQLPYSRDFSTKRSFSRPQST